MGIQPTRCPFGSLLLLSSEVSKHMHTVPPADNVIFTRKQEGLLFSSLSIRVEDLDMNGRVVAGARHWLAGLVGIFWLEVVH